jgi:dienelactone hydrolase
MKRCVATLTAAFLAVATAASAQVQKKDIDIKAPDGVSLKATYFSPERPGPAILLLHQCNMDRHAWDSLASDLAGGGVHVLTLDFRGYGESGGDKLTDAAQRRAVVQEKWPGDVDAAYAYLLSQKGVDTSHLAAGGASCGVTQSSDLAARHHDIKTLLALSGTATDATRTHIAQTPALAIFGAASDGDSGAAKGIREILDASKNPRSTVKIYGGTEHGVPMFARNPELEPMIVAWMKQQLLPKGGTR